jgi:squalene synthase HpnC
VSSVAPAPTGPAVDLAGAERSENFPVALRLLPADLRADLRAVYAVARTIDDLGDDPGLPASARLRRLDAIAADLAAAFDGAAPRHPAVRGLVATIRRRHLQPGPFLDLVEANRVDQTVTRYARFDDLRGYCRLSADPVGRIVLRVFGVSSAAAALRSDSVCTALQVLEHCQDVGEDKRLRDRVYLPLEDLTSLGVEVEDLGGARATEEMRAVVALQVRRARDLLQDGHPLVSSLRGWARVAVAGFVAGGLATADALDRASYDVWGHVPRPRRRDVVRHAARLLTGRTA